MLACQRDLCFIVILFMLALKCSVPVNAKLDTYDLNDYCDQTIHLNKEASLHLPVNQGYNSNVSCTVYITDTNSKGIKFWLNVSLPDNCDAWLDVSGSRGSTSYLFYKRRYICKIQTLSIRNDGSRGRIRFRSSAAAAYGGFNVLLTHFNYNTRECSAQEKTMFQCENSGCIPKSLKCNSRNNCGDYSDEDKHDVCKFDMKILAYAGFAALFALVSGFYFWKMTKKKNLGQARGGNQQWATPGTVLRDGRQPGVTSAQPARLPHQTNFPSVQTNFPPPQTSFPPNQTRFPPSPSSAFPGYPVQQGYSPPGAGYVPPQSSYPPPPPGNAPPPLGYVAPQQGYSPPQPSCPPPPPQENYSPRSGYSPPPPAYSPQPSPGPGLPGSLHQKPTDSPPAYDSLKFNK